MANVLFRVDSSSIIGTGHLMRDLVLAARYKNSNVIFATQNLDGNINNKIQEAGYSVELLNSNDLTEVVDLIKKYHIDLVVIDHYDIDYEYERELKSRTGVKILSFDDTYEKHHCDILLNHNISADEKKYKSLVPRDCEIRCGIKYTLLRDEFYNKRREIKKSLNKKNIFLGLGGTDPLNLSYKIIKLIGKDNNLNLNIVTTNANPNLSKLKRLVFLNKKRVKLYVNCNNIAELMRNSDLAIVTPSVIVNEVISLKLPMIAIKIAENQNDMFSYLKRKRFKVLNINEIKKLKGLI